MLTANLSVYVRYVNTFACQNYLHKIVLLCIFVSACHKRICGAQCKESYPFQAKPNNTSVYYLNSKVHPDMMAVTADDAGFVHIANPFTILS